MLSRVVVPVGALVAAGPLTVFTVRAAETASEAKEEPCQHCHTTKILRPSQLSLYDEPSKPELVFIPEPETAYTQTVSSVRQSVWEATKGMQGGIDAAKNFYGAAKEYTIDATKRVQEDSGVLQRAGIITVAGLGGVVAGYKGGVFRKMLFAGTAMTTAAAVCYPNQAVDISSAGLNRIREEALGLWEQASGKSVDKSPAADTKTETKDQAVKENKDKTVMQEKSNTPSAKPAEDPGQSRPEDKDLYTTRS